MSVRLRYKSETVVSSSTAEEKDLGNQSYEVVDDDQGEGGTWKTVLAGMAANVQLNLGNVAAANFLSLRIKAKDPTLTPGTVQIRLNSPSGELISVRPMTVAKEGLFKITCSGVTAVYATNTTSVVMDVIVSAAGD
jgi:hypothetical protein